MITRVDQVRRIERRQRAVGPKNLVEEEWDTVSPKSLKEAVVHGISKVVELGNGESNPRFHGSSRQNLSYQNTLCQNAVNNVVHLVGQVVWIGLVGNIIPADVEKHFSGPPFHHTSERWVSQHVLEGHAALRKILEDSVVQL